MERKSHFRSDGVHHATIDGHRFHLRSADPSSESYLWIDGRQPPLVLDRTATRFVVHLVDAMWRFQQGDGDESRAVIDYVVDRMASEHSGGVLPWRGRLSRERIAADLDRLFATLMRVADGGCPVDAGLDPREVRYAGWIAPARMDLAITYRCNLSCGKCYVGERAVGRELDTAEWLRVYERLWSAGVPQVVFTGGEPTLREDLLTLVSEADEFVTGLVTNGTRLRELAEPLRDASLDYAQVTVESFDPRVHDRVTRVDGSHAATAAGIEKALGVGLQVVTNTTLTKENAATFVETIRWLGRIGVRTVACNTLICSGRGVRHRRESGLDDDASAALLRAGRDAAREIGVTFQWYSPTCYREGVNPLELGLGIKTCSAAAHNMTVQPDGTVLPCQSWPDAVGDILKDDWRSIWEHPTCKKLRAHLLMPAECRGCEHELLCAGGCPLDTSPRRAGKTEGRDAA